MLALLAIVLVVVGVAIGVGLRPLFDSKPASPPPAPVYTDQQVADAKAKVCAAFKTVAHAMDLSGVRNGGDDPTAQLAVATSGQLVLEVGSRYLLTKLAEEPATPPDLAAAIRKLANSYQELAIDFVAGLNDTERAAPLRTGDEAALALNGICK